MSQTREARYAQFQLEAELRARILKSSRVDRPQVIEQAYADLFAKFPDHSAFRDAVARRRSGRRCAGMIRPLTQRGDRVLEVGCGRGDTLAELAKGGLQCVGIDPSRHMLELAKELNVTALYGTADRLPFPDKSFDLVFSQQVLEHVHPEDVPQHFTEARRVLRRGGLLAVETPNRRTGPQDISEGFAAAAAGLHLKEWSMAELLQIFRAAGFSHIRGLLAPPLLAHRSTLLFRASQVPGRFKCLEDLLLALVPAGKARRFLGKLLGLDDLFLVGRKGGRPFAIR